MTERRVIVTIELLTDEKLEHLSSSNRWQQLIGNAWANVDELSFHVAQVAACELRARGERRKAKKPRKKP